LLTIDMHTHILPNGWPDLGSKYNIGGFPSLSREDERMIIMRNGKFFREIWKNIWDIDTRIEEYAAFGVDVQVVCTVPIMFCYHAEAKHTLELARFLNDDIARTQQDHPREVIGLGTIPMQDTGTAISELVRLREQLSIPGVQIGSNINNRNLNDPEMFPIFEAAMDLDMAIMVHPWEMMGSEHMPQYWLPWLVGMPAEISRAICSLIFGGVLERLPELRFCFAHGGGAFPYTIGRIEHGFNMRPDLVATDNPVDPRDYLGRFFVDSVTHDPQALRYLMDVSGEDTVMMGTDYPFPLGEQEPGSVIRALNLPVHTQEKLFHGNTLRWLGLDLADFT